MVLVPPFEKRKSLRSCKCTSSTGQIQRIGVNECMFAIPRKRYGFKSAVVGDEGDAYMQHS